MRLRLTDVGDRWVNRVTPHRFHMSHVSKWQQGSRSELDCLLDIRYITTNLQSPKTVMCECNVSLAGGSGWLIILFPACKQFPASTQQVVSDRAHL